MIFHECADLPRMAGGLEREYREITGKSDREGSKPASRIIRKGLLLGLPGEPEIAFSSTGRGKRPSRAFPGSPETAFSSTGKGKRQSQGAQAGVQNRPKRGSLGPPAGALKLLFPRQAGGKGRREHSEGALK